MKLETNKSGYFFSKKIQKNLDKFGQIWILQIRKYFIQINPKKSR